MSEKEPSLEDALRICQKLAAKHNFMIVEGIGGIMVPLTKEKCVLHFAKSLGLPTIIVAGSELGTINHTLLTVKICNDFGLNLLGIIINGMPAKVSLLKKQTVETIRELSKVRILSVIPYIRKNTEKNLCRILGNDLDVNKILVN
jgi:dethiobiotin synthetase